MSFSSAQLAIVVDASITVPFLAGDMVWSARWQEWAAANALLLAPPHYPIEVANALLRSARVPAIEVAVHLQRLFASGVETADRGLLGLLGAIELASKYGLSVYDAAYLDLALDVDGSLATIDKALARAAVGEGVGVVGPAS